MTERRHRIIEHTADLGVAGEAPTLEGSFMAIAEGMFASMGVPNSAGRSGTISCEGEGIDLEDLLVGTLGELLAHLELDDFFLESVDALKITQIADSDWRCQLSASGVQIDRERERSLVEVKAVTYHALRVEEVDGVWHTQVILDL